MIKIRILLIILMFFFSVSSASPAMAQEKARDVQVDLTAEERAFLAGKQLRLGVDVARPPFEYLDEEGAYTGISAEFSRLPPSGLASQLFRRKG